MKWAKGNNTLGDPRVRRPRFLGSAPITGDNYGDHLRVPMASKSEAGRVIARVTHPSSLCHANEFVGLFEES